MTREMCYTCLLAKKACYCHLIRSFTIQPKLLILTHPIERKRHNNTGRMAWLSIRNAELLEGIDFTHHERLNQLLAKHSANTWLVYPHHEAWDLSSHSYHHWKQQHYLTPQDTLLIIIDGTWATARKTMSLSKNLQSLAKVAFDPPHPSRFQIRRQPHDWCLSSIEAIHYLLGILEAAPPGDLQNLLAPFDYLNQFELQHIGRNPRCVRYLNKADYS